MANFNFYVINYLLVISTLKWRTSTSLPVRTHLSAEDYAKCSALFVSLLRNITDVIRSDVLCSNLSDKATVSSVAETVQACMPNMQQNSTCMAQRNTSFSETECVMSIMKDMSHYNALIESYLKLKLRDDENEETLLSPTLDIIHNLKNCFRGMSLTEGKPHKWLDSTFDNRHEMCKIMRGFHIRAITINRAMGYISSGEHRK